MTEATLIATLLAVGNPFWAERDVTPSVTPATVKVVDAPCGHPEADGCMDRVGGSSMELRRGLVREAVRYRFRPNWGGDDPRMALCVTILHEQGHSGGIDHTERGLMSPDAAGVEPYPCKVWLKRTIRRERANTTRRKRS